MNMFVWRICANEHVFMTMVKFTKICLCFYFCKFVGRKIFVSIIQAVEISIKLLPFNLLLLDFAVTHALSGEACIVV